MLAATSSVQDPGMPLPPTGALALEHLDAAVGDEAHEAIPMFEAIANCAGNDRFAGHAPEFAFKPRFKSIDKRLTLCLTHRNAFRGAAPTDPRLDCIKRSNARERFLRDRRRTGFRDLIKSLRQCAQQKASAAGPLLRLRSSNCL